MYTVELLKLKILSKIIGQIAKQGGKVYADFERFADANILTKIISR